jgi:hypothetical protein
MYNIVIRIYVQTFQYLTRKRTNNAGTLTAQITRDATKKYGNYTLAPSNDPWWCTIKTSILVKRTNFPAYNAFRAGRMNEYVQTFNVIHLHAY